MRKPIIVLTIVFTAGILLGQAFLFFPYSTIILVTLAVLVTIVVHRRAPLRSLLYILPGLAGIASFVYSTAWLPSDHYLRILSPDSTMHSVAGRIASALDRDPERTGFTLEATELDGTPTSGLMRASVREAAAAIGYGDRVRISGRVFEPQGFNNPGGFDYGGYLARNRIYRMISVKDTASIEVLAQGRGVFRTIQDWRERIRQSFLASTSGEGSAILQAMVLGEEGALTDEMRDRFLAAGVTHIISISGSHLGMVAVICFGMVRMLMLLLPEPAYHRLTILADPKKIAAWITLPLVIFYTALAGAQVATVRSLVMILAGLAALILDRENALLHALATAALLILIVSPQALFDISFQLSFLSVVSIGFVVQVWTGLPTRTDGFLKKFGIDTALLVIISFCTSLATGPLVVRTFNQISLAGLISNIVVIPFAGLVVVPLGLFSGVLSLFLHHLPLAWLNQFVADWFVKTVYFSSRLPFAELHPRPPGLLWLVAYMLLVSSLFLIVRSRLLYRFRPLEFSSRLSRTPVIGAGLSFIVLCSLTVFVSLPNRHASVIFPDVGQGDCAFVRLADGKTILIDGGGTSDDRFDIGRRIVAPFLWSRGVRKLDLVVLSHPHPDHMNGLKFILEKFAVRQVLTHSRDEDLPGYDEFQKIIADRNIPRIAVAADDAASFTIGEAEVRVLHPAGSFESPERKRFAAENDDSLVLRIALNNRVLLFPGDIGRGAEQALLDRKAALACDLIKVPHHGSKSSSSEEFLAAAHPALAVITVGRANRYHHPSPEVVERYEQIGCRILRTDLDGALFIDMGKEAMRVTSAKNLELRRTDIEFGSAWQQEKENWKRVWVRKWEI
jgi:competence protein ComEC